MIELEEEKLNYIRINDKKSGTVHVIPVKIMNSGLLLKMGALARTGKNLKQPIAKDFEDIEDYNEAAADFMGKVDLLYDDLKAFVKTLFIDYDAHKEVLDRILTDASKAQALINEIFEAGPLKPKAAIKKKKTATVKKH